MIDKDIAWILVLALLIGAITGISMYSVSDRVLDNCEKLGKASVLGRVIICSVEATKNGRD